MRVLGLRFLRSCLVASVLMAVMHGPVAAAELKISLAELAKILTVTIGDAKLRLHNLPGGAIDFTAGSSLTIGSTQVPLPVPARTFVVAGTTYAYYVNNLNSGPIFLCGGNSCPASGAHLAFLFHRLDRRCFDGRCTVENRHQFFFQAGDFFFDGGGVFQLCSG